MRSAANDFNFLKKLLYVIEILYWRETLTNDIMLESQKKKKKKRWNIPGFFCDK